jgi:hypothetical protein
MKLGEQERADIITLFREDLRNPSKVALYSAPTVARSMTGLGYSYLMLDDTLDPRGEFITKKAIDTLFGGDALVLAETLAKKSPENAPDMYNKMTNMSSVAADRLIAKAKANLDIINRTAMQEDLLNPFVFKVDNNGNITGSFNMENVSKNSFIKNSLAKNDVINPNQIDQATFWKVMEDYTSIFDKAPLISDQSYQELKDSVESLQTLSKFSLKLPNVGGKPNAHSTIVARLPDLFSGKTLSLEEMTPAQIRRQAREFEKPARVKAVEGTR